MYEPSITLSLCTSLLISLSKVLLFSVFKYYVSFVKCILQYFTFVNAIVILLLIHFTAAHCRYLEIQLIFLQYLVFCYLANKFTFSVVFPLHMTVLFVKKDSFTSFQFVCLPSFLSY